MPRVVGPGSYNPDIEKKLPNCEDFLTKAERKTKLSVDNNEIVAPPPGTYTPYNPPNPHSSTYVFNSSTKRGCQVIPAESAGPGSYNLDKKELHPVSFPQTDRFQFDSFKPKPGVGPAHYVNTRKHQSKAASLEFYSERFFPIDKSGVYLIPEDENDKKPDVFVEKVVVKKRNKTSFNSSEERFSKNKDFWVKKKVAPDPGFYDAAKDKKIGFFDSKVPRFIEKKNIVPGPGNYSIDLSPLKKINDSGFLRST